MLDVVETECDANEEAPKSRLQFLEIEATETLRTNAKVDADIESTKTRRNLIVAGPCRCRLTAVLLCHGGGVVVADCVCATHFWVCGALTGSKKEKHDYNSD